MQIDWITVSAQIVNFLILVWLLKRFLYQPVLRAMDRREQRIKDRLNEANSREQQAQQQRVQYQNKEQQLEQQREELLTKARKEAEQEKHQLLEAARDEINEKQSLWQQQVEQEKDDFLKSLRDQAGGAIQSIARRALTDLADTALEQQIVDSFMQRLKALDDDTRSTLSNTNDGIQITTSFALKSEVRSRLTRLIHDTITNDVDVQYQESPDLVCGIELFSGGQTLSWNIASYLDELSGRIDKAFSNMESIKE